MRFLSAFPRLDTVWGNMTGPRQDNSRVEPNRGRGRGRCPRRPCEVASPRSDFRQPDITAAAHTLPFQTPSSTDGHNGLSSLVQICTWAPLSAQIFSRLCVTETIIDKLGLRQIDDESINPIFNPYRSSQSILKNVDNRINTSAEHTPNIDFGLQRKNGLRCKRKQMKNSALILCHYDIRSHTFNYTRIDCSSKRRLKARNLLYDFGGQQRTDLKVYSSTAKEPEKSEDRKSGHLTPVIVLETREPTSRAHATRPVCARTSARTLISSPCILHEVQDNYDLR
ncbi:hypothetical protein J6590_054888 [Homalodisca vitripennis]|nr:hypothetical protein J6590_054888 [Homalodisca vitripennis]